MLKQRNKDVKPANNNGSKCILTVRYMTVVGFCHSNLFRASARPGANAHVQKSCNGETD